VSLPRVITTFLLLPLLLGLERGGFYAMRSALPLELVHSGGSSADFRAVYQVMNGVTLTTLLVAAAIGIFARPVWLLLAGSLIAITGYGVLAFAGRSGVPLWAGIVVIALGQGLAKPAVYALAALELRHPREQLRSALFVLLYGGVNAGAFFAAMSTPLLYRGGSGIAFLVAFGFQVVAAGLVIVLAVVGFATRKDPPEPAKDAPPGNRVILGAALVALLLLPYFVDTMLCHDVQYDIFRRAGLSPASFAGYTSVNPSVVMGTAGLCALASLVLHFLGVRLPALYATAAGFCLTALAATPFILYGSPTSSSTPALSLVVLALFALAVGEVLVTPYALSRMLGDAPPRATVALSAGWFLISGLLSTGLFALAPKLPEAVPYVIATSAFVCLGLGVGAFFAIPPLYRAFYAGERTEPAGE
jgi:dipeptide/tripeptide permease